jgi:hypothetical protein
MSLIIRKTTIPTVEVGVAADELPRSPVFPLLRELFHQQVVIDAIEEFLHVPIDHDSPAFGDVLLFAVA